MSDVLERLRADNPAPKGSPPSFEEVWERIEREDGPHSSRRRRGRRTRTLLLASLATVPVVLVALVAVVTLGHKHASGGSEASALSATLLHYRVQTVYGFEPNSGARNFTSWSEVWASGSSVHVIATGRVFNNTTGLPLETQVRETATDGQRSETWSANSLLGKGTLYVGPAQSGGAACGPFFNPVSLARLSEFCAAASRDPAGALKQLYDRRELRVVARDVRPPTQSCPRPLSLPATSPTARCRLDELNLPYPGWVVEIFVRHGTFTPVEVIARSVSHPSQRILAGITDYQHLPLTASTRRLLQMRPHPGATVFCVGPGGAAGPLRATGANDCVPANPPPHTSPPRTGRLVAQINLDSPTRRRSPIGIAEIRRYGNRYPVKIAAHGLSPTSAHTLYAIWLTGGSKKALLLGLVPNVGSNGRLKTGGDLPRRAFAYRYLLISLEHTKAGSTKNYWRAPQHPSQVVLQGPLPLQLRAP